MSCGERIRLLERLAVANGALRWANESAVGKNDTIAHNSLTTVRDRTRAEAWKHLVEHRCCENLSSALIESSGGKMNLGPSQSLGVIRKRSWPIMRIIWCMLAQVQLPTSELSARVAQIRALYESRVIQVPTAS
jgi:hypothetical protein